jgi:hypothetical protein
MTYSYEFAADNSSVKKSINGILGGSMIEESLKKVAKVL